MANTDACKQLLEYINTFDNVNDECVNDGDGRYDTWWSTEFDMLITNANMSVDSTIRTDTLRSLLSYIQESN